MLPVRATRATRATAWWVSAGQYRAKTWVM